MEFGNTSKIFLKESISFFLWGVLLLAGFEFYPEAWKTEAETVLMENIAFKTIVLLFFCTLTASGLFLMLLGAVDNEGGWKARIYEFVVVPPAKFGINLCAVAFGLILATSVVSRAYGYTETSTGLFLSSFFVVVFAVIYWGLTLLVREEFLRPVTGKHARLGGLVLLIAVPSLSYFAYPVT